MRTHGKPDLMFYMPQTPITFLDKTNTPDHDQCPFIGKSGTAGQRW